MSAETTETITGTLTFLGTGTSMGVPAIGCTCPVCTSSNSRDKRLRPSVLLRWPGTGGLERNILIDTGPDFRTQALRANLTRVDAVFYTHSHADHILGLDDLRPLSFATHKQSGPIPLYVTQETRAVLERIFEYTFSSESKYPHRARVELRSLKPGLRTLQHEALVDNLRVTAIPVLHGDLPITGYRIGSVAYLTDVSTIPDSSYPLLENLDTLIVSSLRHAPHPSHATVAQATEWARRINAKNTWFTHISHDLGHEETNATLPAGISLAWDELSIPFTSPGATQ